MLLGAVTALLRVVLFQTACYVGLVHILLLRMFLISKTVSQVHLHKTDTDCFTIRNAQTEYHVDACNFTCAVVASFGLLSPRPPVPI